MGVGFFKPHLPFNAPRKYWDLYDTADIAISPVPDLPDQVSRASLHGSGEFNQYALGEEKASLDSSVSPDYARHLRHAYLASVSYTDAQVGKVLKALEDLGLSENTIVVLWGDHGWHLGDHRVWGKHTIFEQAVRSALIIKAPGISHGTINRVVSTVDIYPTLMQLCNTPVEHPLDGRSLLSLMQSNTNQSWDDRAFSYFRKGISLRTPRYRYTRYFRNEEPVVELYDHRADPYEGVNVATSKPEVADSLFVLWKEGQTGIYEPQESIE